MEREKGWARFRNPGCGEKDWREKRAQNMDSGGGT